MFGMLVSCTRIMAYTVIRVRILPVPDFYTILFPTFTLIYVGVNRL